MQRGNAQFVVLFFRQAWVFFILIQCANKAIWWHRAQRYIAANRSLEPGYRRLIRRWFIYGNLPWLVMGAGVNLGGVPSVFHYFNLRNGPFVIAFWVTVVALWIATSYWLFFPWATKIYFSLALAGGVVALVCMAVLNIQFPAFR